MVDFTSNMVTNPSVTVPSGITGFVLMGITNGDHSQGLGNAITMDPTILIPKPGNSGIAIDLSGDRPAISVRHNSGKGIDLGSNGLEVKVDNSTVKFNDQGQLICTVSGGSIYSQGCGIVISNNQIAVNPGDGISTGAGVKVVAKTNGGIGVDSNGVYVRTGSGIAVSGGSIVINIADIVAMLKNTYNVTIANNTVSIGYTELTNCGLSIYKVQSGATKEYTEITAGKVETNIASHSGAVIMGDGKVTAPSGFYQE